MVTPETSGPWRSVGLGEICELLGTQIRPSKFSQYKYYVGLEDIDGETGRVIEYQDVGEAKLKSSKFFFDPSCVLYGKLRPYLNKVALPDVSGICSTDILPLRPDPEMALREYIYYAMRTLFFVETATSKSTGANLPRITPSTLLEIRVPLPSIHVQRKIVAILQAADNLRRKRQQANQLTDKIIQSVFLKMFGDPATNPIGWKVTAIGDHSKIRYGTSQPPPYEESGIPFVRATDIKMGRIVKTEMKFISPESASKIEKCRLKKGNLIIVRSGVNTGDSAYVPEEYEGAYAAYDLILDFDDELDSRFVWALLNMEYGRRIMKPMTLRAAQPHLNAAQVSSIRSPQPPVELQHEFVSFVTRLDVLLEKQAHSTAEIYELFHSLMHRAFRGELRSAS